MVNNLLGEGGMGADEKSLKILAVKKGNGAVKSFFLGSVFKLL